MPTKPGQLHVIPDLPAVNYGVWVRGYGLVDSPKMRAKPGQHLDLTAVPAPTEAAAAHYYLAIYWYSLLKVPPASEIGNDQIGWFKQTGASAATRSGRRLPARSQRKFVHSIRASMLGHRAFSRDRRARR